MFWCSSAYSSSLDKNRAAESTSQPPPIHRNSFNDAEDGLRQQWQADLVDLSKLKKDKNGMTFLLTVIDIFSKVAWCVPMKNKSAASLVAELDTTFSKGRPKTMQTDQGLEFLNKSVQAL